MKKLYPFVALCAITTLALSMLPAGSTSATVNQEIRQTENDFSIAISPPFIEFDIVPGQTTGETIRLRNTGLAEADIRIGVAPLSVSGEDYSTVERKSTPRTEITKWTDISLEQGCSAYKTGSEGELYVHLRVQEECYVRFATSTPSNAPFGSQHMNIYFEEVQKEETPTESGIRMIRSLGANVYATNSTGGNGSGDACGKLKKQSIPFWVFQGSVNTSALIENCGVLDFHATLQLEVKNLFGSTIYKQNEESLTDKIIMAETTREVPDSWDTPTIGIFKVIQTVKFLDTEERAERLVFVIPIWLLIAILVCLLVAVLALVHKSKQKRSRK